MSHSLVELNNSIQIPQIGLGVFRSPAGDVTVGAVQSALDAGYRHIDTARIYGNEADVGRAIRDSDVAREAVFVTTKLWNDDHGYDATLRAFDQSLDELGFDYIDLYLVHWPVMGKRLDTWRAMEALLEGGRVRAIGVSNYMVQHLDELLAVCRVPPSVNQIELSPYNYRFRKETLERCAENQIVIEAYSPLTKGQKLSDPSLVNLAEKYGKSTAQLLIRWVIEKGYVALPKSVNAGRIQQNGDVFDFEISASDMQTMDEFNENLVTGWDPTVAP